MHISQEALSSVVLPVEQNIPQPHEYYGPPGKEHYHLLAWLSSQFHDVELFDFCTDEGLSTTALAFNPSNTVIRFSPEKTPTFQKQNNCQYYLGNLTDVQFLDTWKARLLASPLIFVDLHPHTGVEEMQFYTWLLESKYQGILVLDDIWCFKGMRDNVWAHITTPKWDLTSLGHWSGLGLVDFSGQVTADVPMDRRDKWTLVTAYFDLTQEPDASEAIRNRPFTHYLKEAHGTMALPQNLVVYCDQKTYPYLKDLRPKHLQHKTQYILRAFNDFDIVKTRSLIAQNRREKPYKFDSRNTPSYYLFCMLRYIMIQETIQTNPFDSTHFAWVNINIENYGWKNLAQFQPALSLYREKFSTCWIDYLPQSLVQDYPTYFEYGRCGMCSGFFTGNTQYMGLFIQHILVAYYDCLKQGYGHADEQLFSIVYYQHPDIFDHYFGNYADMVTNYVTVIDGATEPVRNIITNSFRYKDYAICLKACHAVWTARDTLPPDPLKQYIKCYMFSAIYCQDWPSLNKLQPYLHLVIS